MPPPPKLLPVAVTLPATSVAPLPPSIISCPPAAPLALVWLAAPRVTPLLAVSATKPPP